MILDRQILPKGPADWARNLGLALAVGATIGIILWLPQQGDPFLLSVLGSAWVGVCIYFTCLFSIALFARFLDFDAAGPRLWIPMTAIFFLAGAFGFSVGGRSLIWMSAGRVGVGAAGWSDGLAFAGVLGIVGGIVFFTYARMKDRLEQSIEQLKDREMAARELETARIIQRRLLPPSTFEGYGYRLAARNLPARVVAGDFFDVLPQADGRVGIVVADVVGKGMGASLIMAGVKARLGYVTVGRTVPEAMAELNGALVDELAEREFVALAYLSYEPATGRFELANAGLPDPYVLAGSGEPRAVAVDGPRLPLGVRTDVGYRSVTGDLGEGESLLMLTDGLPESLTPRGEPFGYPGLEVALADGDPALTPSDRLDALVSRCEAQTVPARDDDWTLVLLERLKRE